MNEFIDNIRASLNAPWAIILACPISIIAALHFSSREHGTMYGSDTSASLSASIISVRSKSGWIRIALAYIFAAIAAGSFYYMMDPLGAIDLFKFARDYLNFMAR
jgi:hypothetical protein